MWAQYSWESPCNPIALATACHHGQSSWPRCCGPQSSPPSGTLRGNLGTTRRDSKGKAGPVAEKLYASSVHYQRVSLRAGKHIGIYR